MKGSRQYLYLQCQDPHTEICALIRELTEDVLLEPRAARDDYAVQALELLAHYHPLATQRVPPAVESVNDAALPSMLGENLLQNAMQVAEHLRYPAKSPAMCSLRRALLVLYPKDADFAEEYSDLTVEQVSSQQSHLNAYTKAQLPQSSDDASIDAIFRHIGTVTLVRRTRLTIYSRQVMRQMENCIESLELSAREAATDRQTKVLRSALDQVWLLSKELKTAISE